MQKEGWPPMVDYLYDGTFEGFLTCIHAHYYEEKASGIYRRENYQANMLSGSRFIETDEEKAVRVYEAIERKISKEDLRRIYRVFLSSNKAKENILLRTFCLGSGKGRGSVNSTAIRSYMPSSSGKTRFPSKPTGSRGWQGFPP
jgi:probable DNA metabolism protein